MDAKLGVLVVVDACNGSGWDVDIELEDDVEVEHIDVRADMNGHVIVDTRGIVEDPDSCSSGSSSSGCLPTEPGLPASSACSSSARAGCDSRQSMSSLRRNAGSWRSSCCASPSGSGSGG